MSLQRRIARLTDRLKRNDVVRRMFGKAPLTPRRRARRARGLAVVPVGSVNPLACRHDEPAVVLVSLLGADAAAVAACVEDVARAQMQEPFAPLFVVTTDDFSALRSRGYLFEYVPPPSDWEQLDAEEPWDAFVAGRLATLVDEYGPDTIVAVPTAGDGAIPLFQATVAAIHRSQRSG